MMEDVQKQPQIEGLVTRQTGLIYSIGVAWLLQVPVLPVRRPAMPFQSNPFRALSAVCTANPRLKNW